MELSAHIAALQREGDLLAATAAATDLDTPIPTCPGWRMRDLLRHVSGVHRWAATYVREARPERMDAAEAETFMQAYPDDRRLVDWFRAGHSTLVSVLSTAPADLSCWRFLPAPSPLTFWARRQAHETAIHRADAESPRGDVRPYDAEFAADGLDELLAGFFTRRHGRLRFDPPRTLHIDATDHAAQFLITMGPERVTTSTEYAIADCHVRGLASDLYLFFWNRRPAEGLQVSGDRSVLDAWREQAQVRWG